MDRKDGSSLPGVTSLERWLAADPHAVRAAWRERDALHGSAISWDRGSGTAAGVDETRALRVDRDGGGRTALDSGEVHLRRG